MIQICNKSEKHDICRFTRGLDKLIKVGFKFDKCDKYRFTRGLDKALQAEEEQEEEECPESLQVVTNIIDKTIDRYNILNI